MIVKCPKCNKLLEVPNEKFGKKDVCEYCEHVFVVDDSVVYKEAPPSGSAQASKVVEKDKIESFNSASGVHRPKTRGVNVARIVLGVILAIVLIYVGMFIIKVVNRGMRESGVGGILPPETHQLVAKTINISAGEMWYLSFSCPNGSRLQGSVSVASKDVHIWLIEGDNNLMLLKQGKEFYYIQAGSGKKIAFMNIDCPLNEGSYHFIVDNSYSIFTSKQVTVNLSLLY